MSRFQDTIELPAADRRSPAWARRAPSPALSQVFPLLLAVAEDELAEATIRVSLALARRKGAVPTVVHALGADREVEDALAPFVGMVAEEELSPEFRSATRATLQKLVTSIAGNVLWRLEVDVRSASSAVAEVARQMQPGLIVMGLRQHGVVHRVLSRSLLRSVVRSSRLPVLAVTPGLMDLPRRIVVAVDFGDASIHAARMARQLLADGGELHLVHVATDRAHRTRESGSEMPPHAERSIRERLDRLAEDLSPEPGMTIVSEHAEGDAALSIKGCAERIDADLIAVGSDRHSPLERLVAGSVSMALAHTARWSMLIVPGR
ncbi:MAG: universal stress protein [Gemmatimonadaceae bacterium]